MIKANRWLILAIGIVGWLFTNAAFSQSQYYDKFAYIKLLPSSPLAPKSLSECEKYSKQVDRFVSNLEEAHDACLRIETKANVGNVITDTLNACSNSKCQELHTARIKQRAEAESKKTQCKAAVTEYEAKQQKCKPPEDRSCANQCGGEWGMRCPFTTVCDPIKHRCEKTQP